MSDINEISIEDIYDLNTFRKYSTKLDDIENINKLIPSYRRKLSGIYIIYSYNHIPLYVGQTTNMRNRIIQHIKYAQYPINILSEFIGYVEFVVFKNGDQGYVGVGNDKPSSRWVQELLNKEKEMIMKVRPFFNGATTRLGVKGTYGYENYREDLDSIEGATSEEIDNKRIEFVRNILSGINNKFGENKENKREEDSVNEDVILTAMMESIKLAVKHKCEEESDEIIKGLLVAVQKCCKTGNEVLFSR